MSSKNKSELRTENSNNFPNNNSQFITPEKLRDFNNDVIDSMVVNQDTGSYLVTSSFDTSSRDLTFTKVDGSTYTNNIPDATVATGSLLETASFDNSSRNMTFTKGDASTFDINIPGSTLDTGSLLVTASVVDATTTYTKGDSSTFTTTVNNVVNATSASHAEHSDTTQEVIINVKNTSGGTLTVGTPVYATGVTGDNINVEPAVNSSASTMPAIAVIQQELSNNAVGEATVQGKIIGVDTSGFTAGRNVYVHNGDFTDTKPTGSALIQNIGVVGKVNASEGEIIIQGSGRSNDLPNIAEGYVWVGDSNGVPQAILTSSFAESTDTGSFINTGSDAQTKNANIVQSITAPGNNAVKNFIQIDSTENNGLTYTNNTMGIQNYPSFGRSYQDTLLFEFYNSLAYNFGTELGLNGGQFQVSQTASGSGAGALFRLRDDYAAGTDVDLHGTTINIGTFGGSRLASGGVTIGRSDVPVTIASNELNVTGPVNISGTLTASMDTGNVLVGNGSGISHLVATSSFAGTIDSSSFAIKDQSNTFTEGPQIASASDGNGIFTSKPIMPTSGFGQKILWEANNQNLSVDGNGVYNVYQESLAHFNGYGRWYDGSWYQEFYNSSYSDGAEVSANGGGWRAGVYASGSSNSGQLLIQDNYDGNTGFKVDAQTIDIGTGGGNNNPQNITIGKINASLNLNSSDAITVSGSIDIEGSLTSSLQSGYVWVGDGTGRTTTAATSSFGGGGSIDTGSLLVTSSATNNVITFTKGDGSTYTNTIDTGSGGGGGAAFPYTGDAQITGSLGVSGSLVIQGNSYPDNRLGFKSGSTEYVSMYIDTGSEFVPDAWVINHHTGGQIVSVANANGWLEINTVANLNNSSAFRGTVQCREINQDSGYTATWDKTSVNTTLTLSPQNPLPSGAVGEMATSGSNLYFHNGTEWKEVSFV